MPVESPLPPSGGEDAPIPGAAGGHTPSEAIWDPELAIPERSPSGWVPRERDPNHSFPPTALDTSPPEVLPVVEDREPAEAPRPHPGFWWAILWCLLMVLVAQVIPALAVLIVLGILKTVQAGSVEQGLAWLGDKDAAKVYLKPTLLATQVSLTLFSLVALRLVAGRDWARQVGLRLPSLVHVVLALIALPALWLSAAGVYLAAKTLMPGLVQLPAYALTFLGVLAVVSVYWLAVRWSTGRDWTRELQRVRPGGQVVLSVLGVGMAVVVARVLFTVLRPHLPALDMFEGENLMEELVKDVRNWPPAVAVLIIGVGPGLGEELFCRAFLGRGLVGRHGVVMGVLLTSLFFGLIHLDPHQGTMAALMGVALHYAYLTSRSLLIPMLLHFLNNSLSVLADKLPEFTRSRIEAVDSDPDKVPTILFLGAGLLLTAVAWAMYRSRARLVRADGEDRAPWRPPFPGAAWPPAGSGTRVAVRGPGWLPSLAVAAGVAALAVCFYLAV